MKPIRIVTDNACDLPDELLAKHNVIVVPLDVRLGDFDAADLRGISAEQFWKLARQSPALAETSAPAPGAFHEVFAAAADDGSAGVVCVTISSGLSATYQAARAGAEPFQGKFPVAVIDSLAASVAEGLLVLEAADLVESGADFARTAATVQAEVPKVFVYGTLDTLEYLRRGGRIGNAQAFFGSLLSIKPVIVVRNGVVEAESRQRTRARSLEYLASKATSLGPLKRLAVGNADADDIDVFLDLLAPIFPPAETLVSYIGPIIGAHTGPGTIALFPLIK
ncbi:MAG TPA: DegV family protein [Acidimicrobiales bacterium]|nr:DegV family protein [Acidimicrobiales bacterium]